ncbi:hypothetical protein QTI33_05220 [Variovorax sp. J22P271]|uniref:hypothetical protein n=1 Tax=Variovorax davisae TaxID=3053515 RepID=UPI002575392E|nr:hypothetical protein [Variovorax sp. J22P271]MDM0031540.1 hypothetical protein [Variovorax sp. J22P271]
MPALRIVLLLRGAVSVLFALSKLAPATLPLALSLSRNGAFALVDGLLGLALAFAVSRSPRYQWLFGLVLADALVRLLIGLVAIAFPDVEGRILGSIAFFGAIITACMALGVFGLFFALRGRSAAPAGPRGGVVPALVVSACTLLLGVGLLFGFGSVDARRLLIGGVALGIGLCLLASGLLSKDPRSIR